MIFKPSSFLTLSLSLAPFSLQVVTGLQITGRDVEQLNRRESDNDGIPFQYFDDNVNITGSCGILINSRDRSRYSSVPFPVSVDGKYFAAGDGNDTRTICQCRDGIMITPDGQTSGIYGVVADECTDCGGGLRLPDTIFELSNVSAPGHLAPSGKFNCKPFNW